MHYDEVLPVKYLKPIIMQGENKVITRPPQAWPGRIEGYEGAFATQSQTITTTTETQNYTTGAEFSTEAQAFQTGADLTSYAQTTSQAFPTYETTQTTTTTTSSFVSGMGATSGFKLMRRGSGITQNEQDKIVEAASSVLQQGLTPISNNTAKAVKKILQGDWLVIAYPDGKQIDFNMTCVQGNDYLYFVLNQYAFQVCRLV